MIIDGYYNTWERGTRYGYLAGDEFGAEQMLQAMDVAGVDMAVACSLGQAVPVLIAHMGTVWNVMEAILVAERTPNLYLETSWAQLLDVRAASRRLGPEKIIMGTDWPGSDFDLERMKIARAIPDPEHRQRVEGGNLAALPGLEPGRMTSADRRDLA